MMSRISKMSNSQSKVFRSSLKSLPKMLGFVRDSAKKGGLSSKCIKQVELAAEEALVNVISYAYQDIDQGKIKVSCAHKENEKGLLIEIEDQGMPFNPLEEPIESPKDLGLSERKVGGLGRFFISKLMDQVNYERKGKSNILKLFKYSD